MGQCSCRNKRSNCQVCFPAQTYVVPIRECNSSFNNGGNGERGPTGLQGIQGVQGPPGVTPVIDVILNADGSFSVTVNGTPVGVPIIFYSNP